MLPELQVFGTLPIWMLRGYWTAASTPRAHYGVDIRSYLIFRRKNMKSQNWDRISRRQFLKAIGAGAATAALAACTPAAPAPQPTSGPQAKPTSPPAAPATTVQFWDMVWGPPEYVDTGKKLIDQFNGQSANVKATYQSTPWSNWYQTFLTAIGAGAAPDLSTGAGY